MSMTSAVYQTKRLDEVRPTAGRREELETPQLLASYLAKIGRGKLLTHQEKISLSRQARAGDQRARKKLVGKADGTLRQWQLGRVLQEYLHHRSRG
jgi:hypothetical protein